MKAISVSVPGSIMLMGEHAVLFGEPAIACAIDKYIHIQLTPRNDDGVNIESALASHQTRLRQIKSHPALTFVMAAISQLERTLPAGFELTIESEFAHTVGLGSSAAVTAGVVAALHAYAQLPMDTEALFDRALSVVHEVQQGRGSGSDLVASIQGGLVAYRMHPKTITALSGQPVLGLYYAGYKTPTPEVLKQVETKTAAFPELYSELYRLMGQVTEQAIAAIESSDWTAVGRLMNTYQGLLDALGVNDAVLSEMVYQLRQEQSVLGAKISGSGLGDCVVSLGGAPKLQWNEQIPVAISERGVSVEYH